MHHFICFSSSGRSAPTNSLEMSSDIGYFFEISFLFAIPPRNQVKVLRVPNKFQICGTCLHISLSTVVLNSRDRHEKTWRPTFSRLHNTPHNTPYPKKPTGIHWLLYDNNIPSLNSVKILTVRSVENFKVFEPTSIWSDCQPASQTASLPAVRPTSTRSMATDFSHNKGNHVQFTKLLFRLRFIHCAMAFLFILYPLTTCENLDRRC